MPDGPLMPPSRRGPARPATADSNPPAAAQPVATPQPTAPANPAPAQPRPVAIPTAKLVEPAAVPVARPAPTAPVYAAPTQPAYVAPTQPAYVAPTYAAPQATASAWGDVPSGTPVETPSAGSQADYSETLVEVQQVFAGTRVWVLIAALVGALSGIAVIGRVLFILYITRGRLTPPLILACLAMMLSASIGLLVSYQTFGYAARMRDFLLDPSRYWLESTLAAERNIWRTMGILVILLVFMAVGLTIVMVAGVVVFEKLSE